MAALVFRPSFVFPAITSSVSVSVPLYMSPQPRPRSFFSSIDGRTPTTSSVLSCSGNHIDDSLNPEPDHGSVTCPCNPGAVLLRVIRTIRISALSHVDKIISPLPEPPGDVLEGSTVRYLQNRGIGVALLSLTYSAGGKMTPVVATLAANPTFVSGLLAWFAAQLMKVVLNFFVGKTLDVRILFARGGMPSSHSALCIALTTSVALCHGLADSLFPVCLGFSLVVMYDAIGVRRHAGMQAEVLNKIVKDLFEGHPIRQRKLKELLGHTPSQVLAGALLGFVVACFCHRCCSVAT